MPNIRHSLRLGPLALLLTCGLAGCVSSASLYQPRSVASQSFGYSDVKIDTLHYSVSYSANRAEEADNFLELRAAQIAQSAGFQYYVIENRGANSLKFTENDLETKQMSGAASRSGRSTNINDTIPEARTMKVEVHFNAWGQLTLLTPDQAAKDSRAKQASQILAQFGPKSPS